jgi:hypothetical protein
MTSLSGKSMLSFLLLQILSVKLSVHSGAAVQLMHFSGIRGRFSSLAHSSVPLISLVCTLYEPIALAMHTMVILSLLHLWPGALCSVSESKAFVGKQPCFFISIVNLLQL